MGENLCFKMKCRNLRRFKPFTNLEFCTTLLSGLFCTAIYEKGLGKRTEED